MGILSWRAGKFVGVSNGPEPLSPQHFQAVLESFCMDRHERSRVGFGASFEQALDAMREVEGLPPSSNFAKILSPSSWLGNKFAGACAQLIDPSRRAAIFTSYAKALGRHLNPEQLLEAHGRLVEPAHPDLGFELTRALLNSWIRAGGEGLPRIFGHAGADGPRDPWSVCLGGPAAFFTKPQCSQIVLLLRRAAPALEPKKDFWRKLLACRPLVHDPASAIEERIWGALDAIPDRINDPELGVEVVGLGVPRSIGFIRAGALLDALAARGFVLDHKAAMDAHVWAGPLLNAFHARQEAKLLSEDCNVATPPSARGGGPRL